MVYEVIPVTNFRIKHRDFFHLKNLYVMMHEWLVEEFWATRKDYDFPETFMYHNITQKSGKEIWVWWRLQKDPDSEFDGSNEYYRYVMKITFHVILLKDVEVMHQGQKFKSNWGEVEIKVWTNIVTDWKKKWEKNPIMRHLNDFYRGSIMKGEFEKRRDALYRETYRFREAIKTYLKLKLHLPEPELNVSFPSLGVGE